MRKIPTTMVSQHPDNACKPYWHSDDFINTRDEAHECFLSYSELGVSEYKWDWEGKFVDESVIERLLGDHFDFFQKNPLGKEKFLTFRLPNPKVETEFRLGRAFMVILAAEGLSRQVGLSDPPLFEVILPMTETAQEMIGIQEAYREIASLKHELYNFKDRKIKHVEIIPLFEKVDTIINSHKLLEEYQKIHKKKFGSLPTYMRPYLARSDPALNSGLVPTILAIKIALSQYKTLEKKTGIKLYPIIGSGSLPFRGGLTPDTISDFTNEYKGIKTALIQSAFRYDFQTQKVIKAIKKLDKDLPKGEAVSIPLKEEREIEEMIRTFEPFYRDSIEGVASMVNGVASYLPRRRERVLHIGLFGYSRGVGSVKLPRAIGFTGALYSLGIPPEILGTGRGLREIEKKGKTKLLEKYYVNFAKEIERAGHFFNSEVLGYLKGKDKVWEDVQEDVKELEKYLGHKLGPKTKEEKEHYILTTKIFKGYLKGKDLKKAITKAAILRRSLG